MERFFTVGWLLQNYGKCLTEHQYHLMDMHYEQDLSLGEIAETLGITRQGVADTLRRAERTLDRLEEQLGLSNKVQQTQTLAGRIAQLTRELREPQLHQAWELAEEQLRLAQEQPEASARLKTHTSHEELAMKIRRYAEQISGIWEA